MSVEETVFFKKGNFLYFWIFSAALHGILFICFLGNFWQNPSTEEIHLTKGSTIRLYVPSLRTNQGLGSLSRQNPYDADSEGTIDPKEEMDRFRNSLSYPAIALEQRLEDDCSFRVTVAENGSVEKVGVLVPCRYGVFDQQFRNQVKDWKFNSSKGKEITLPIRFRIHARE
ncbi:LIC_10042 family TonB-like protein [Leptospira sp. 'Mane']|uniref:LIC_10042 family TonB-like protein n=1 Tax=Leptospira sp. 'Mane' TaxID=3387407 RepID=UPI00398B3FE2